MIPVIEGAVEFRATEHEVGAPEVGHEVIEAFLLAMERQSMGMVISTLRSRADRINSVLR